ncbi:MAG TPA: beta-ketoacyl-ACP synthase II [Polyangiaceae bacterium]|jgi:3-oxoacyl-[acyl-carrier-protein] synthase II|nr:beta-ketoacyl-ACP synthase II [Polyangiaceae bacterium]
MNDIRRVVITGLGAVSPCGPDTESTWSAIRAGKSGIAPITRFDASAHACRIAGEVKGFSPERWIEKKKIKEGDTFIHLSIAASRMAVESSGFEPTETERERVGTLIGVGLGGLDFIEKTDRVLMEKGPNRVTPYFIPATIANLAAGQVSMLFRFKGACFSTTGACASGSHAIGEAFRAIRHGYMDAAVAGGCESCITPLSVAGFSQMRALSTRNAEPERASRPFDRDRDGFVLGEGAGVVLLEERDAAIKRGAKIHAELVGYGATADAYHLTQPAPEGEGAQRAMRMALDDAHIAPGDVAYVNAHGTSTGVGDVNELLAIRKVFGAHATGGLLVSSTKSMTGHLLGGAGSLETVLTVLAVEQGIVPPTINLDNPVDEAAGMDLVAHNARETRIRFALNNSFGFGGTNTTLVLKRHE